jgi:peptide deformylase
MLTGFDVTGRAIEVAGEDLEARVWQHENDHLDGVLILDRAPREQRKAALRALRAGESYAPAAEADDEVAPEEHREPRADA